ncbi:filamentous hemagglutinin N-terminal domain-containing protein, partial [Campylobacter sp. FU_497]|uniref:two-partner secretion domain-containing protein n=1 Tax=Campylobacter sp. FU_497 TaxID=2911610 RepID=UPI0021E677A5
MKKLANHIILSGITVSMLLSPMVAADKPLNPNHLPSGGKFTHGTTGNINIDGNTMYVNGTTQGGNHVIQWGGGFSIGKNAQVKFGEGQSGQNYLNIAHGTSKSTIEGILNAGGNNVFLINPNGVIIEKSGSIINANRFVASTSSMDSKSMQAFADGKLAYNTFSPVFKPNGGNVVNMGNINAKNVTLQGNKVVLDADTNWDKEHNGIKFGKVNAENINLQGNEVYVDVSSINGNKLSKLNIKGGNGNSFKGSMYLNASGYYYNPSSFKVFNKFNNSSSNFKVYKYVGIGSDVDWWHFAKGWNENKDGIFRNTASEYRLTNDIDFKASNGQNYANYCIDGYGCTNMIVGFNGDSAFTKTFDGQGYTLKNINIDTVSDEVKDKPRYVGLFGKTQNATFENINVDYMGGGIDTTGGIVGGFVGIGYQSDFYNISINNSGTYNTEGHFLSGFGSIYEGKVQDVIVNNSGSFKGSIIEGFGGGIGKFSSIVVNNSGIFNSKYDFNGFTQGFGPVKNETMIKTWVNNIIVNNTGKFYAEKIVGLGNIRPGTYVENIIVNNSGDFYLSEHAKMYGLSSMIYSNNGSINSKIELKNIIVNNTGQFARGDNYNGIMFYAFSENSSDADISNVVIYNKGKFLEPLLMFFVEYSSGNQYENIHIYIDDDAKKSLAYFFNGNNDHIISNFNIYTHEDTVEDLTPNDKINIHAYSDSNKDEVYNKFKEQADTISKPILPIMPPPSKPSEDMNIPDVEKIKDETATLDQGDLISDDIWDDIINDIDKVHYNIDIRLLAKLLSEYSNISNKTEDEQVKFITTYLGVKENDARALLQSLSFLNAYKDHDISKANFKDKTVKDSFENSFKNAETKFTKFNNNKNKLYNNLNDLNENIVSKGFNLEYLLEVNQEELAKAIKAYNDYVVLIEKGLKNENDPAFISIKNTIIKLNNEAKNFYAQLLDYKGKLQDFKDNNEFEKVIIAGDFKTIPLLITPDVNKPIDGGGEDGDYEKISRQVANSQKQTPTFEYEEEETEEVDE